MKREWNSALTLIETLVSVAVMGIMLTAAYATIHQSLRLHGRYFKDSVALADRCALSEQLASDLRLNLGFAALDRGQWELTRSDGAVVSYVQMPDRILRIERDHAARTNIFAVGRTAISLRGKTSGWHDSLSKAESATAVRLKFTDSELILAR